MRISQSDWEEAISFLAGLGIDPAALRVPEFQKQALDFLSLLLQKNELVNLTGAKDLQTAFWKHLVDSLALLSVGDLGAMVDWGSGGGFPAIPVALARKHRGDPSPVYFLDSVGKKVRAVQEFCEALQLPNAHGHIGRGEELLRSGSLGAVDTIVMRAVAPAERAVKWVKPLAKQWILLLGPSQVQDWQGRSKELSRNGMKIVDERKFFLPRDLGERSLLRISKSST